MDWLINAVVGLSVYFLLIAFMKSRRGRCRSRTDLSGKTAIITGCTRGIGLHVALDLATRNAKVILANRPSPRAEEALKKIKGETGNPKVFHKDLDLASHQSVRRFVSEIVSEESRLDILVNNAATYGVPKEMTEDGLEMNMATNHFGPFLLTNLLLDLLKKSAPSRIIVTSSMVYDWGNINFDNLNAEKSLSTRTVYFDTKLANVLFTRELSQRLHGTKVTVNCLHPGSVQTDLLDNLPFPAKGIFSIISKLCFRSPEEGAQTTIHLAVSEEVEGVTGKYFSECKENKVSKKAVDSGVSRKLWEISEKLTGLA